MVVVVALAFRFVLGLGLTAAPRPLPDPGVHRNYTTWPNIGALMVTAPWRLRLIHSSGLPMLAMMGGEPR